jgi:gluconate 2-dehydrogenase subunit 3-like protein
MAEKENSEAQNQSQSAGISRRDMFHIIGSVPVAVAAGVPALAAEHDHAHSAHGQKAATPKGPYKRKVFDDQQWRTVQVLCDLIIPADDRSGSATQAGVPEFIDDWIDFRKQESGSDRLEAQILGGLMWLSRESLKLSGKEFAEAAADQQKQILDRIAWPDRAAKEDHAWVQFFNEFRNLTVSGFFSSKIGVADLPYLGNTAVAEWKGCDPKVWAIIEERMKNGYKGPAIFEAKPWKT